VEVLKKTIKTMERENTKETKKSQRRFSSHEEVKTQADLQDLINSFYVKENLTKMLSKIEEMII